jgi:hypothetical protein
MGCSGGPEPARHGGIFRRSSGIGRPSTTGIGAGQATGHTSRYWTSCGEELTWPKARTGRWVSMEQSSGLISTPPELVVFRRPMCRWRSSRPWMWTRGARANDRNRATMPSREAIGRSRGGLTSKIHPAADSRCRPISRLTTAGHRHDALGFPAVMAAIRILRPAAPAGPALARAGCSAIRRTPVAVSALTCVNAVSPRPSRAGRPARQPSPTGQPGRPTTGVRPRRLQGSQHRGAGDQQAQGLPGGGHPLRQTRLRLPRNHRRGIHQDLAPGPSHMIYGTGSNGQVLTGPGPGHVIPSAVTPPHDRWAHDLSLGIQTTFQRRRVLTHRPLPAPNLPEAGSARPISVGGRSGPFGSTSGPARAAGRSPPAR